MSEKEIKTSTDHKELVERYFQLILSEIEFKAFKISERNQVLKERKLIEVRLNKIKPDWRKEYNL